MKTATETMRPPRLGVPLVAKGFSEAELLDALYALERDRAMQLLDGNRIEVVYL